MDKEILKQFIDLLPLGRSISFTEAERRAGRFLEGMALVIDARHRLGEDKIKRLTTQTAIYAEQLHANKSDEKGSYYVSKAATEASKEYQTAREEFENVDNDMAYLKAMYDIFNNAHIFYRNQAKGENV